MFFATSELIDWDLTHPPSISEISKDGLGYSSTFLDWFERLGLSKEDVFQLRNSNLKSHISWNRHLKSICAI